MNRESMAIGDVVVCRCEQVSRKDILKAVGEGATTVAGVKKRTRACMGVCQGRTCGPVVRQILARETGRSPGEVSPGSARPPVRPIMLGNLGSNGR